MRVIDLNGNDQWSPEGVRRRYATYAEEFRVVEPTVLQPKTHTEGRDFPSPRAAL
jgi:hypothetical protein